MSDADAFGVVREHRWPGLTADEQAAILRKTNLKAVYSLGGGKLPTCTLADLSRWATAPGRVFRVVHLFLLAEPAKHTPALRRRLQAAVNELVDKRGAVIEEVDSGLTTAKPGHRRAMMALAREMIARSCQGAKSATNGKQMRGRQLVKFSREQIAEAKRIWRDTVEHPTWEDAAKALSKIKSAKGEKFTVFRARKLFGERKSKR